MAEVIPFRSPYVRMLDAEGITREIPVSVFERIRDGSMEVEELEDWRPIVRAVIGYWLDIMESPS